MVAQPLGVEAPSVHKLSPRSSFLGTTEKGFASQIKTPASDIRIDYQGPDLITCILRFVSRNIGSQRHAPVVLGKGDTSKEQ